MANLEIKLTKEQQQYLVMAVLFIGGGGFAYVKYFWLPTSKTISETEEKIVQVERKITKAKGHAGRLGKVKKELAKLKAQAAEAASRLPEDDDIPGVLELITGLTKKYNFNLASLTKGGEARRPHFDEVNYSIVGSSTFHDLGRFLAAIALQERIFTVRGLSYGAPTDSGEMGINFTLVAYKYKKR